MKANRGSLRSARGAVLVVAMLVASILGISLVSYIRLNLGSLKLANRSFYSTAAMNLAETGVEEALWCFNQQTAGAAPSVAWTGWNLSDGVSAKRAFTDLLLSANATSKVAVYTDQFDPASGAQPKIVARAEVRLPDGTATIQKWVEVALRRRSRYAMGLVAKNQITFRGNLATVDSWNSLFKDDGTARAGFTDYSAAVKHDRGSVGSASVSVASVAVNNADIWGYVSVGASSSSGVSVGSNGTVAAFGNPQGTVDSSRIATDFSTNFDVVSEPGTGTVISGTFPATIGTAGTTTVYRYAGTITKSFTVQGNVTLILTAGTGDVVRLTGGDTMTVEPNSSLNLYASGDLRFTGNGITNATNNPTALQIFGTKPTTGQQIEIGGGAYFKGLVYAPNADIKLNGNPDVMGSLVGNNIDVVGNAQFHYDESLASFGGDNPWGVVRWRELTTAPERAAYSSALSGL